MSVDRATAAIQALKEHGYEVGEQVMQKDGIMRIGVRSRDASAWVNSGDEIVELAAGRVTLDEIMNRRRTEGKT